MPLPEVTHTFPLSFSLKLMKLTQDENVGHTLF